MEIYDIVIIGYGPVSQALALACGRQGRKVAVVERWEERYPLPRAVGIDHEAYRILAAVGLADVLEEITHPGLRYEWFNAEWKPLLVIDWTEEPVSGGHASNFVCQPVLEDVVDQAVTKCGNIDLYLGWEAVAISQDGASVTVTAQRNSGQEKLALAGRFAVGCDGANSMVRPAIGSDFADLGFQEDWLVVDVRLKVGVALEDLSLPEVGQYCDPTRPTTLVPGGVDGGRLLRRWEFMRLPHESIEDIESEAKAWELLSPWVSPDQVEMVRHRTYRFRSLLATKWREDRVLLAGDAAHLTPPFLGQGLCSGLRDAWALAWRLGLILDGKAGLDLLDSYQEERYPHVRQLIEMAIFLGRVICIADPEEAAKRDTAFASGSVPPFPAFPHLVTGLLRRNADGKVQAGAGELGPHVMLDSVGTVQRMDDHFGPAFLLIVSADAPGGLGAQALTAFESLGGRIWWMEDDKSYRDLDCRVAPFMREHGWSAMLIRPDFYVYGGAVGGPDVANLVDDLLTDVAHASEGSKGVCATSVEVGATGS